VHLLCRAPISRRRQHEGQPRRPAHPPAVRPWSHGPIGAGASQTRIEQTPIDGQPGRYLTTIGPLHPDINNGAAWPTSTSDTGPLVLKTEGSSVMAVIDGHAVFPTGR
jgi:hypothetical protein